AVCHPHRGERADRAPRRGGQRDEGGGCGVVPAAVRGVARAGYASPPRSFVRVLRFARAFSICSVAWLRESEMTRAASGGAVTPTASSLAARRLERSSASESPNTATASRTAGSPCAACGAAGAARAGERGVGGGGG